MNPFEVKTNFNSRNFNSRKEKLGFEEILFDSQLEEPETVAEERFNINYRFLSAILVLCFLALFGRIYYLQAMKGEDYRVIAEGNKLRNQHILAPRGLILDKYGKVIAGNVPAFELVTIPNELPEDEGDLNFKLSSIAEITSANFDELKEMVGKLDRKSPHPTTLIQNLEKDPALVLIGRKNDFKGFAVQNNPIRDYKDAEIFAHVTGYTGKITADELKAVTGDYLLNDYIGKTGLELQYESQLKGIPGSNQTEINAQGDFNKALPAIPAVPGNNVKLSIDYDLQHTIYNSVMQAMSKTRSKKGAVVATNPQTGQVLALISFPGYDGNMFARGIKQNEYSGLLNDSNTPLLNRVVSGTYPPGSTVKPMIAIGALSEGIVTPQTKILDDGLIRIGSYTFYGYRREGLGIMDVYSAIARSSDIYFYTVGGGNAKSTVKEGMGAENLAKWYRHFGLGSILGIAE
jgi:penicillin-binding protein 2